MNHSQKDFLKWHRIKARININDRSSYFYEREIWWCSLGLNIGYEQDGKGENFERPVIVLKKFNLHIFIAIPLTSKQKFGKYYYPFNFRKRKSVAIVSQIRILSSKRLIRKIGIVENKDFFQIREKIKNFL